MRSLYEYRYARMQAVLQVCDLHLVKEFQLDQNYTTNIIDLLREVSVKTHWFCWHLERDTFLDGAQFSRYNVPLQISKPISTVWSTV